MRSVAIAVAASALAAVLLLARWPSRLADIEVRYQPRQTQTGRLFPGFSQGEGFVCERDGLRAIDVALAPLGRAAPGPLELALHVGKRDGPVLRRATLAGDRLPSSDGWARFEFDPVPDSADVTFFFDVSSAGGPSTHSPWTRYRGYTQLVRPWGDRIAAAAALDGEWLCVHPDLHALAFAVDGLDAAAGPATLVLSDAATGEELRRCELRPHAPLATGWACFGFEAIANSRWRKLRYHLEPPPNARLVGDAQGLSLITFHGGGEVDARLRGATCGGETMADRDLVFRAWSGGGAGAMISRLEERGGRKLALAAALWLAGIAVLASLLRANVRGPSDS